MSHAVCFFELNLGRKVSTIIMASDAQGGGEGDHGGYGVVCRQVPLEVAEQCFQNGTAPHLSVCTLDGEARALKYPERSLARTKPSTRLPSCIFEDPTSWYDLQWGRWKWTDHITLGEGRGAVHMLEVIACHPALRRHIVVSLQDNFAFAGAVAKGRSTAIALNFILRRISALSLASNLRCVFPWTQTSLMPADELSRRQPGLRADTSGPTPFS